MTSTAAMEAGSASVERLLAAAAATMEKARYCWAMTVAEDGSVNARPMGPQKSPASEDPFGILFLTRCGSRKALEIIRDIRHPHLLDVQFAARVDFLWRARKVIAEADGLVKYNDRKDLLDERERDHQLREAGYTTVHFTWRELFQTPEAVIARLRTALAGAQKAQ